jgi:hypothetical protein
MNRNQILLIIHVWYHVILKAGEKSFKIIPKSNHVLLLYLVISFFGTKSFFFTITKYRNSTEKFWNEFGIILKYFYQAFQITTIQVYSIKSTICILNWWLLCITAIHIILDENSCEGKNYSPSIRKSISTTYLFTILSGATSTLPIAIIV